MLKKMLFLLLLLAVHPCSKAEIALVSQSIPLSQTSAGSNTFAVPFTVGNLNVLFIACDYTLTITGVTDSAGNTWTLSSTYGSGAVSGNDSGNAYMAYSFSAHQGVTSVTVASTGTGALTTTFFDMSSLSGGALDTINALSSQDTANPAPSLTAAAGGVVIAGVASQNTATAVSAPFTLAVLDNSTLRRAAYSGYSVGTAGGAKTATFTAAIVYWASVIASFVEAPVPVAATPTASPASGSYTSVQLIALSSGTTGATICYTQDGTTPAASIPGTCSHGATYYTPFVLSAPATVQAIATKIGDVNSSVLSAAYTITLPTVNGSTSTN